MAVALVLSAGGMFAAWEIGVWKVLSKKFQPDLIVGASAGAFNGWAIASGATPDELAREWLEPSTAEILKNGVRPQALYKKAREVFTRSQPKIPFALTLTEVPRMRARVFPAQTITWQHLAASSSVPFFFPPVKSHGKRYVDGGLLGALPVWAAQEMGATRVIAINAWTYQLLSPFLKPLMPKATIPAIRIEPSERLGSLRDATVWSASNIERWLALGERDGNRAAASITI
jgi:predicted acylesterase/phospholipase RssA